MNVMIGQCLVFSQCAPWWFGIQCGILNEWDPFDHDIANSSPKGSFWSWMLPSNKSNPCERLENLVNIVNLLDFHVHPPINFIGSEVLWLALIYYLGG
jgi:hypothetical protein